MGLEQFNWGSNVQVNHQGTTFERKNLKTMLIESYCCGPPKSALLLLRASLDSLHVAIVCGTRAVSKEAARLLCGSTQQSCGISRNVFSPHCFGGRHS